MSEKYNHCELLEIAADIEETGKKLYTQLMDKTSDEELKAVWCFLAQKEEEHKKIFSDMLASAQECTIFEYAQDDYSLYLKAVSENYVFTARLIEEKKDEIFASSLKAVEFAISMEKESILTYSALKEVLDQERRPVMDKVIAEEQKHWVELEKVKKTLVNKGA